MSATQFDRKKAVMESIEGMSKALNAVRSMRMHAEAEIGKWQAAYDSSILVERYAQHEMQQLVRLKNQIEQEEKSGG